jgi:hypothetical protein
VQYFGSTETRISVKRLGLLAALSVIIAVVAAWPALAVGPTTVDQTGGLHVCAGSTLDVTATKTSGPNGSAFLTATGEVCGAGQTATANLTATATAVVGCINRGSKDQEPSGLQETTTQVAGSQTFNTRAGRGSVNVRTDSVTIPEDFSCPPPMTETLVSVTFTDIVLTITSTSGTITATFPDIDP